MTPSPDAIPKDTRSALAALAGRATDALASCIPVPDGYDAEAFAPALEANLLEPCDGGFVFTDPEAHAQAVAEAFLPDAEAAWGDPAALVTVLHRIRRLQHRGFKGAAPPGRLHPTARLLLVLQNGGHDVASRLPDLVGADLDPDDEERPGRPQQRKVAVTLAIEGALSVLEPTAKQATAVGLAAAEHYGNAGGVGHNYLGLGTFARDHPDAAREALALLMVAPIAPEAASLVPHLLHGLAAHDADDALLRAVALTDDAEPLLARAGVLALGSLYFPADDSRMETVLDRLDALSVEPSAVLDGPVAQSLAGVPVQVSQERAVVLLSRLASRPSAADEVARAVADLSVHVDLDVYRAALPVLAANPGLGASGTDALQSALYNAAQHDSAALLDVAEAWARSADVDAGQRSVTDFLGYLLGEIDGDVLAERLPVWFTHDDALLRRAAADAVNEPSGLHRRVRFGTDALSDLDVEGLLYLVRQSLGQVHNGRALARLLVSMLDLDPLPDRVEEVVAERLHDYVWYTWPVEAEEVLGSVDEDRPTAHRVARDVLARVEAQAEAFAALPRRIELAPPPSRVRTFHLAKQRWMSAMQDRVMREAESPLMNMVANVPIRGGRGAFVKMADGSFTVSEMVEHTSPPMSLRGEIIDPVGQAYRRFMWRHTPRSPELPPKD